MIKIWLTLVLVIASATPAAVVAASKSATPEARVQAFLVDYFRIHGQAGFRRWNAAVARLDKAHFISGGGRGLSQVMSSEPEYLPGEEIVRTTRTGKSTLVETRAPEGALAQYHEFELREVGHDWRIVRIRSYFKGVDEPFMTPDQRPRFEHPKAYPLDPQLGSADWIDGDAFNFHEGQKIHLYKDTGTVEVRRVGTLSVTSGVLVVGDLGYSAYYVSPLGQRIPAGQYPVEVAVAFKCVAGLRVIISNQPVVTWHAAKMGDGGNSAGVDAGNVAITDTSAVLTVNGRHVERTFEKFGESAGFANAQMLSLANPNDAVISNSGFGDGSYPVYWGADASGKPAVLLIDFFLLGATEME
jgi:hypothetical protein